MSPSLSSYLSLSLSLSILSLSLSPCLSGYLFVFFSINLSLSLSLFHAHGCSFFHYFSLYLSLRLCPIWFLWPKHTRTVLVYKTLKTVRLLPLWTLCNSKPISQCWSYDPMVLCIWCYWSGWVINPGQKLNWIRPRWSWEVVGSDPGDLERWLGSISKIKSHLICQWGSTGMLRSKAAPISISF